MLWGRVGLATLLSTCVALAAVGGSEAGSAPATTGSSSVRIEFTGKGGGRYLDTTRWLREDTRECYARRTADEDVSVSWKIVWTGRLVERAGRWQLVGAAQRSASVTGSVAGKAVRDSCDAAEDEPGWGGTDQCNLPLPVKSAAGIQVAADGRIHVRAPGFGSPGVACDLAVRNDQLEAHVLNPIALQRVLSGRTFATAVGTRHPSAADQYVPTQFCSAFPHIYEGIVYIYDCLDTLIWNGKVSVSRA